MAGIKLSSLFEIKAGMQQSRIIETEEEDARTYYYYSSETLKGDLLGADDDFVDYGRLSKVSVKDKVTVLHTGNLVFSLMAGFAAIVSNQHDGYLQTQNFVTLVPSEAVDKRYFAFLLNEDTDARKKLSGDTANMMIRKISIQQLRDLEINELPPLEKQRMIGDVYFKAKHLTYLRSQALELHEKYVINALKTIK